jgi:hypothetical protein
MFSHRIIPGPVAVLSLAFGALAAGCSSPAQATGDAGGPEFIATAVDFSCSGPYGGFRTWSSTPGVGPPGAPNPSSVTDGGIHAGPMVTYINTKPPGGSTSFPIGTIIVKEQSEPPLAQRQIFAMVKRGGGYNDVDGTGAVNWEFFELTNLDRCDVSIVWSGFPTNTDPYASNPLVCDECHYLAKSNDYVWTAGLSLSSF